MENLVSRFGIHIKTKDFARSYDFYKKFGFKEEFAYGPKEFLESLPKEIPTAPENYCGVTFNLGGAMFELGENHIAIKPEVFKEAIKSSKVSAMLDVESVEEIIAICEENNFEIAKEPTNYSWGTREVVVRDPDGFILVFRART